MELMVVAVSATLLCFFIFYDREKQKEFIRQQQERRDQQILEWDLQLRQNPWLRDVYEGRVTQQDIEAAKARHPEKPEEPFEWNEEGF